MKSNVCLCLTMCERHVDNRMIYEFCAACQRTSVYVSRLSSHQIHILCDTRVSITKLQHFDGVICTALLGCGGVQAVCYSAITLRNSTGICDAVVCCINILIANDYFGRYVCFLSTHGFDRLKSINLSHTTFQLVSWKK